MPSQLTIDVVLDRVTLNNSWVFWARDVARHECAETGWVTIDDVRRVSDLYGYQPDSPKAFGAVFKQPGWTMVGRQRSTYQSNNGRYVCQWQWNER